MVETAAASYMSWPSEAQPAMGVCFSNVLWVVAAAAVLQQQLRSS
jgi:hypothetical protein